MLCHEGYLCVVMDVAARFLLKLNGILMQDLQGFRIMLVDVVVRGT